jgi:hypothetical protein
LREVAGARTGNGINVVAGMGSRAIPDRSDDAGLSLQEESVGTNQRKAGPNRGPAFPHVFGALAQ